MAGVWCGHNIPPCPTGAYLHLHLPTRPSSLALAELTAWVEASLRVAASASWRLLLAALFMVRPHLVTRTTPAPVISLLFVYTHSVTALTAALPWLYTSCTKHTHTYMMLNVFNLSVAVPYEN